MDLDREFLNALDASNKDDEHQLLKSLAERGHCASMQFYANDFHPKFGYKKDESMYNFWLNNFLNCVSSTHDPYGLYLLSLNYRFGNAKPIIEFNQEKANNLLVESAKEGHEDAIFDLAIYMETGAEGIKQDKAKSQELMDQLVKKKYPAGLRHKGISLLNSNKGLGEALLKEAADLGDDHAQEYFE